MDLNKAYTILGISDDATPETIKKAYKKLASQFHPDKGGDEVKFKEINEAYQFLTTGKSFGPTQNTYNNDNSIHNIDIEDLIRQAAGFGFGGFQNAHTNRQNHNAEEKHINIEINFRESVLGCQKEIAYKRKVKCNSCDGLGKKLINNGCNVCGGHGATTRRNGNVIMNSICHACRGNQRFELCDNCSQKGYVDTDVTISVNIPPGVTENKNILVLREIGDFAGKVFNMDQYTNVLLHVNVVKDYSLKIENNDVITIKNISLLEALEGTTISVPTIDGNQDIIVPKLTHHKDEVIIPNLGVGRSGNQKVILHVKYPPQISKQLINALKKIEEN